MLSRESGQGRGSSIADALAAGEVWTEIWTVGDKGQEGRRRLNPVPELLRHLQETAGVEMEESQQQQQPGEVHWVPVPELLHQLGKRRPDASCNVEWEMAAMKREMESVGLYAH